MAYQDYSGQWFDDSGNPIADPSAAPGQAVAPQTPQTSFTNTSPTAASVPSGIADPSNPGYDTAGYRLGSTDTNGQIVIPNSATGQTASVFPAPGSAEGGFAKFTPNATPTPTAPGVDHTAGLGAAPGFTPPPYTPPPAFSYADFVAPDPNKLNDDPSYKYALKTEQDAIQRSAAARGVLNTGGTIHDLLQNAGDVANQGYQGLFSRSLQSYLTNRGGALDQYNTNYGTQYRDPYQISYQGANDAYGSSLHNYDLSKQYGWMQNLFDFQNGQNKFDQQYKLLQLT